MCSRFPRKTPRTKPEYVEILFEKGNAIGLKHENLCAILGELGDVKSTGEQDGYSLFTPYGIMRVLNLLGGRNGIGRVDIVENRFVGMKSRGVYETPGGTILLAAHRDLETLVVDRESMHIRDSLIPKYAQLVYNGFWFAPEREAIQALVTETQKTVSGEVRLKLYKGNVMQAGRRSPHSMYSEAVATMEGGQEQAYNQDDATGFIALNALRLKASARQRRRLQLAHRGHRHRLLEHPHLPRAFQHECEPGDQRVAFRNQSLPHAHHDGGQHAARRNRAHPERR
jgi:argininosuccinate synthase